MFRICLLFSVLFLTISAFSEDGTTNFGNAKDIGWGYGIEEGHEAWDLGIVYLEKYWFRQDKELFLCKRNPENADILSLREIIASLIYKKQGFSACEYKLLRNEEDIITGCTCR